MWKSQQQQQAAIPSRPNCVNTCVTSQAPSCRRICSCHSGNSHNVRWPLFYYVKNEQIIVTTIRCHCHDVLHQCSRAAPEGRQMNGLLDGLTLTDSYFSKGRFPHNLIGEADFPFSFSGLFEISWVLSYRKQIGFSVLTAPSARLFGHAGVERWPGFRFKVEHRLLSPLDTIGNFPQSLLCLWKPELTGLISN